MPDHTTHGVRPVPDDLDALVNYLDVLADANRLKLLRILREPHALGEIRLTPNPSQARGNPDRTISRQAVRNHLDKLVEVGLIRVRRADRDDPRVRNEYVLDTSRLFAVVEELDRLTQIEARGDADPQETLKLGAGHRSEWPDGPKLVLVHGVREGRAFPLDPSTREPPRGWIIGRDPDAHVCLDYDPFVSEQNSEIVQEDGEWRVLDLRSSTNGTRVNWEMLPVGGEQTLSPGDIIGVGRSRLAFRTD